MDNEILAIDKFICENNNFILSEYRWQIPHYNSNGVLVDHTYVPQFIVDIKWTCNTDHIVEKWQYICKHTDVYGFFIKFYCELDGSNKRKMLQWILENRKDGYIK